MGQLTQPRRVRPIRRSRPRRAPGPPYERYSLKVYTGHSVENRIPGFISPHHGRVDIDYLDWRFVQDQASCGSAILQGQWQRPV